VGPISKQRLSLRVRPSREEDWTDILALANASVAGVPQAGPQDEWLGNRQNFDEAKGLRAHFVAVDPSSKAVGYGAVESASGENSDFRMFIVTAPGDLETAGELLYRTTLDALKKFGAARVRLTEYAGDAAFQCFAESRGFVELERFQIPTGEILVTLSKTL
jgi:hypothetical protein